jgi:biotin carboxyl carrier protein
MELEIGGRRHVVEVRRTGSGSVVTIDGRSFFVDATKADSRWSMLVSDGVPDGESNQGLSGDGSLAGPAYRSYDVTIGRRGATELTVVVNGSRLAVGLPGRRSRSEGSSSAAAGAAQAIAAPMPGRVVKLLVEQGHVVQAGQPVIVVEAMKMENELRSPRGGTVIDVRVAEGQLVEARTVLLVVDSAEVFPQRS